MQPPSLHSSFFSSLKQVEKRLKLEHQPDSNTSFPELVLETDHNLTPAESLSSPLYLHLEQTSNNNSILHESSSSEPAQEFLSLSPQFQPTQQNPPIMTTRHEQTCNIDDITMLMELLGLSDNYQERNGSEEKEKERVGVGSRCECECEDEFFEKIVRVKGPKCEKEVQRMEGWIEYLLRNGEEPLRLAYLLLGKVAFVLDDEDLGFGGLEFPSTIDDFLKNDPPED